MAFMNDDGKFYVWTVVEIKTGEIVEGEQVIESEDEQF